MAEGGAPAGGVEWSAATYAANVGFVSELGEGVLSWLDPQAGQRVLDLGCGDGALTRKIAAAGASVVGVDTAPDFVRAATELGLDARLGNGEELVFDGEFDVVFSNAALHWMTRAERVVEGVARALKPGGRFVAEFGGHGNVAAIVTAMVAVARARGADPLLAKPWYFPSPEAHRALLERSGFVVDRVAHFARPTPLPTGIRGWLAVFREPFFAQFGDARDAALDDVVAALEPSLRREDGTWVADYWRLRFDAHLVDPADTAEDAAGR